MALAEIVPEDAGCGAGAYSYSSPIYSYEV